MLSGRCYCQHVLSGVIPLESYVAGVIATMADGIAIFPTFRLMLLPICLGGRCYKPQLRHGLADVIAKWQML